MNKLVHSLFHIDDFFERIYQNFDKPISTVKFPAAVFELSPPSCY